MSKNKVLMLENEVFDMLDVGYCSPYAFGDS